MTTETVTKWRLKGKGYEFCNCQPGCTCNFSGFPTSPDGSCKAMVTDHIEEGRCGDVDLSGVTICAIIDWPGPIHEGNGRAVMVVPPSVSDEQLDCLNQIFSGQLGGMPWEILGPTLTDLALVRADVNITNNGMHSTVSIPGVAEATGTTLKNPVTNEDHLVAIDLDQGFIWKRGECGQGSFRASAEGVDLEFRDSNWILYDFDWSNS